MFSLYRAYVIITRIIVLCAGHCTSPFSVFNWCTLRETDMSEWSGSLVLSNTGRMSIYAHVVTSLGTDSE